MDERSVISDLQRRLALAGAALSDRAEVEDAFREARDLRRAAIERLNDGDERHRLLLLSGAQAVWETDAAGVVVADSPSWRAYTGQTLDKWLGYGWLEAVHPEDRAFAERQWRQAVAGRKLVDAEFRLRSPNGDWRWTNVRAVPVLDDRGNITKWSGLNVDIEAQKRLEAVLQDVEARQAFALELADRLRSAGDQRAAATVAVELLSRQLDPDRCFIASFNGPDDPVSIEAECSRDGLDPLPDRLRPTDFPEGLRNAAEGLLVVDDIRNHAGLSDLDRRALDGIALASFIVAPLHRGEDGMSRALVAGSARPRQWSRGETTLLTEAAERTWSAMERARIDEALREREEHQRFLLRFSDALRAEPDADAIAHRAIGMLAEHMRLDRCYVGIYRLAEDKGVFPHQVGNDRISPMPAEVRLSNFPEAMRVAFERTLVIEDVAVMADLSETDRRSFETLGLRSLVASTLRKGMNRPLWAIVAASADPRRWTRGEIALIEEATERTWSAMERARSDAALRESEELRSIALESGGMGAWRWDTRDRSVRADEVVQSLWGVSAQEQPHRVSVYADLMRPEGAAWLDRVMAQNIEPGENFEDQVQVASGPTAGRWVALRGRAERERPWIINGVSFDITEQVLAEQRLRESEAHFRLIADANLIGIGFGGASGEVTYINDEMLRMMGRTRAEFEAGEINWAECIAPEDRQQVAETLAILERDGVVAGFERSFLKPDGERTRFVGASALTTTGDGMHVSLALDMTERVRAEERQTMLMAELDHRVKNILAVVQSIARQSLGRGKGVGPEATEMLIGRLNALAQSHALLAESRWEGARLADIVESAVAAYRGDSGERIVAEGPDLKVTPKAAQTLNLAVHELVTNAAKYGALSRDGGHVTIRWRLAGDRSERRLVVTWAEHGGPPIEEPPARKGFGSKLIEQVLKFELHGEVSLDYAREGLRATIDLPIEKLRVQDGKRASGVRKERTTTSGYTEDLKGKRVLLIEMSTSSVRKRRWRSTTPGASWRVPSAASPRRSGSPRRRISTPPWSTSISATSSPGPPPAS
ncbi:PAS domain-containing protein [Histidinibacterium lentulum]|uniref:PAS domain-containing protein n=1 Tax=Histidinibacterium lentulum TaxID=2480588 RepID=UPI00161D4386|nr:PAS domain-containing protein [Histidinibacterium lentulum]